jgi:predicted nucleotidyltransferase
MTRPVAPASFIRQPLDIILGTTASVRVLRALLAHGGPLPVSRLARDTRITPNGVRDALHLLEQAGAVEAVGFGRTRLFQTVKKNSLITALEKLFSAERKRFEQILETIKQATVSPGIVAVWVFGSVARGEDKMGSDLDVALVIDAPGSDVDQIADAVRDRLLMQTRRLGFSPSVVAVAPADLHRLKAERARLWSDLVRDGRVLKGAAPGDLLGACRETESDKDRVIEGRRRGTRLRTSAESGGVPRSR